MNRADRRKTAKTNKERINEYNEAGHQMMMPGGDPRQAQRLFRQVLALDPGNAPANLRLGVMEMWARNYQKAQELFVRAHDRDPADPVILNNLGLCRHEQGAASEALALYEQALDIDSENAEARINLARALLHAKDFERALVEAKQVVAAAPEYATAHFILGSIAQTLGDLELAKTSLQATVDRLPSHLEANFRLCRVSYDPTDPETYLNSSEAAYKANPDDASTALAWSDILMSAGRYDEVAGVLERYIDSSIPGIKIGALNNLGNACANLGDFTAAIDWHKKALASDINDPGIRFFYGRTLFRSGDYAAAQEQLWRGMRGLPFAQDLIGMLMHTQKVSSKDQAAAAKSDFDNLVQVSSLETTEPWDSIEDLNKALLTKLTSIEKQHVHPFDKLRRHANETWEGIFDKTDDEAFSFLHDVVQNKAREYVLAMPDEAAQYHPMIARKKSAIKSPGAHIESINTFEDFSYSVDQQGWFHMIYFINVPEECEDEDKKVGWLRFGIPHFDTADVIEPDREIKPVAGQVVIFPAYYWHGFNAMSAGEDLTFTSIQVMSSVT